MTNREYYKKTFDHVACSGMKELEVQTIMEKGKRYMTAARKAAVIAAAVVLVFALSNGITYAANGQPWIVGLWNHTFVYNPNTGEDDMNQYTYEGDGYSIQIQQAAVYGEDGKLAEFSGGGGSEGVKIIDENNSILLTFGDNSFDITDQINEKGYAFLKISVSDRLIVFLVEPMVPEPSDNNIVYFPMFYDYDIFVNNSPGVPTINGFINSEEIKAAPLYYAK